MKSKNRIYMQMLGLILAITTVMSVTASCSDNPDSPTSDSTQPSDTQSSEDNADTVEETENVEQYAPILPDEKYDYEFRILTRDDGMHPYAAHTRDVIAEEVTGVGINDAVYYRNLAIEEKYGIKIVMESYPETVSENTTNNLVEKSVMADSDDYDLLLTHMINGGTSAAKNVFLNWNDLPYVDFSKPYWNSNAYDAFSVGEKTYLALSDMCVSSNDNTHCMIFNKNLASSIGTENLYDLVYNNQWTFEKFGSLVADVSLDLNGDSKMDTNDRYGYLIAGTSGLINWLFAAGEHVTSKDESNYPVLSIYNERTISAYEWIYSLATSENAFTTASWVETNGVNMFIADQALIMSTQVGMIEHLRNMDSDFGILPYPKFDEAQENYAHYVDGHATIMAIPKTVSDLDRTGIFLEAISYEAYKTVLPQYYDVMMMNKYVRDEDSRAMFEIVYNTRAFDFAYVYDNFGLSFVFSTLIGNKDKNFSSYYAKYEKIENLAINKVIKQYEKGD